MLKTFNLNKFIQFKIWAQPLLLYFYFAEISSKPYAHKTSALTALEPWDDTPEDIFPIILSHVVELTAELLKTLS